MSGYPQFIYLLFTSELSEVYCERLMKIKYKITEEKQKMAIKTLIKNAATFIEYTIMNNI